MNKSLIFQELCVDFPENVQHAFSFLTSLGHLRLNLKGMIVNKKNQMSNQKPTSNDIYKPLETRSEHQHSKNTCCSHVFMYYKHMRTT